MEQDIARIAFDCTEEDFNEHLRDVLNQWLEAGWIVRPSLVIEMPI